MKQSEVKVGREIISEYGTWEIIWKYSKTFILIKKKGTNKTVVLEGGQFRLFKLKKGG